MLPIFLNGHTVGECVLSDKKIRAKCKEKKGFIYRLRIYDSIGNCFPLGVMMPSFDGFYLEKVLPAGLSPSDFSLSRCELFRSLPEEDIFPSLPCSLSHGEVVNATALTADSLLSQCLEQTEGAKWGKVCDKAYVYFPFSAQAESPMAPFFFCLTVFSAGSTLYAAFCLDENGLPCPL